MAPQLGLVKEQEAWEMDLGGALVMLDVGLGLGVVVLCMWGWGVAVLQTLGVPQVSGGLVEVSR